MSRISNVQNDLKYKQAKGSLLAIILFSFINLFAMAFTDSYFLFSAYFTQLFGYMAWIAVEEAATGLAFVFIFIGTLTIVPYLLCFIFAKKHVGWMIGALVIFSIDTIMLLIDGIGAFLAGEMSYLSDILIHAYAIFALACAVSYGIKAKKSSPAPEITSTVDEETVAELTLGSRTVIIEREKRFIGCATVFTCYIDGAEACKIKNGETKQISIDGNAHEFGVIESYRGLSTVMQLREGLGTVNIKLSAKSTFSGVVPVIVNE